MGIRPWEVPLLTAAEYELFTGVIDAARPAPDGGQRLADHQDRLDRIR